MKQKDKNFNIVPSGYRVLFILKILIESDISQKELNKKLMENPYIEKTFTKEAFIKFINTFKISGINIERKDGKYKLRKLPWGINLSEQDIKTLFELRSYVRSLSLDNLLNEYDLFLESIFRYIDCSDAGFYKDQVNKYYEKYSSLIKEIEKFSKAEQKIVVKSNTQDVYKFDNFKLEYYPSEVYLTGYNVYLNENRSLKLSEIASVNLSPQKTQRLIVPPTVLFKLKGRLAEGYNLKMNEKLLSIHPNEILVSNRGEDKKILIKRLLRYKELCEIVSPESFKRDFVQSLKSMLNNY